MAGGWMQEWRAAKSSEHGSQSSDKFSLFLFENTTMQFSSYCQH